jgi:integrase
MWFEIALKAAKIENFRFHDLRHTFTSRATMSGVDIRTLAQLMGHRTLQMTARYSHLSQPHLAEAVSKLVNFSESSIPESIHVVANPS